MLSSKLTTPISHFFRYDNFIDKDNMGNTMNDFKIINELGKGSYGVVYKVKSNKDDQIYVVKKIELKNLKPKNKKEAFQEVQLLRQLNHHHMIKYYNSFIENNSLFIVMEYAEGGDLQQLIRSHKSENKPFTESEIWSFALQISQALAHLHAKFIIHRDLKALNIFLTKSKQIKLGDLGVSKIIGPGHLAGTRVGTPLYLAPELVLNKPYDNKIDVWALGCVLYHLAMMEAPFLGENLISLGFNIVNRRPKNLSKHFSNGLNSLIMRLLEKDPYKRPSMKEVLEEIKSFNPLEVNNKKNEKIDVNNHEEYQIFRKFILDDIQKNKEKESKKDTSNKQKDHKQKFQDKNIEMVNEKEILKKEEPRISSSSPAKENRRSFFDEPFKKIDLPKALSTHQINNEIPNSTENKENNICSKNPEPSHIKTNKIFCLKNPKNLARILSSKQIPNVRNRPFSAIVTKSSENLFKNRLRDAYRNFENENEKKHEIIRPKSAICKIEIASFSEKRDSFGSGPKLCQEASFHKLIRPQTAFNRITDVVKKKLTIYDLLEHI